MSVQGQDVRGPLHAARLLRESKGSLKIEKLPKRADFDAKYEEYAQSDHMLRGASKVLFNAWPLMGSSTPSQCEVDIRDPHDERGQWTPTSASHARAGWISDRLCHTASTHAHTCTVRSGM